MLRRRVLCPIASCELQVHTDAIMSALRTTALCRRHRIGSANYDSVQTSPCRLCADVTVSNLRTAGSDELKEIGLDMFEESHSSLVIHEVPHHRNDEIFLSCSGGALKRTHRFLANHRISRHRNDEIFFACLGTV
ncbi:unnamed protein product [Cochlearia groenlandica]